MPFSSPSSEPDHQQSGQQFIGPCALAVALVLLVMAAPMLSGRIYVADDLGAYHLPAREFYARCLANGDAFDWWPDVYAGFYLTGEGQVGSYHPLHWALYRWLPLNVAFCLEVLLSYPLLIAGTYVFLRIYVRRDAALFGGLCFGFSGFALLHFMHPNAIAVVSHLPWLLWAVHRLAHTQQVSERVGAAATIGLLTGSQLLLGYPQYMWFSLLAEAVFAAGLLVVSNHWNKRAWFVASLISGNLLGGMLGGVQLLPTLDSLGSSNRQLAPADFATSGSLHPLNLLQLVAPYGTSTRVFGQNTHELGLYFGAVPVVMIAWGLANRAGSLSVRRMFRTSLVLGCAALLYAFGEHAPLYELQTWLPIAGKFRFPCRAIVLAHLCFAVASAIAFSWLIAYQDEGRHGYDRSLKGNWIVASASILVAIPFTFRRNDFGGDLLLIWIGPALVLTATWLLCLVGERGTQTAGSYWSVAGLIFLAAGDLGAYGLSYSVYPHSAQLDEVLAQPNLPTTAPVRVALDLRSIQQPRPRIGNQIVLAGLSRVDGYVGLEPRRALDYRHFKTLQLSTTSYVLRSAVEQASDDFEPHNELWLAVPDALPRVRLLTDARQSENPAADLEHIDARSTVLLNETVSLAESSPGIADILSERPGHVKIGVQAPTRQVLVWAESFHPGWRACSNGAELPVYRAYGDFMACVVEPGSQEVDFSFEPKSLRAGKRLSLCGLGLLLCAAAVSLVARRRFPQRFAT